MVGVEIKRGRVDTAQNYGAYSENRTCTDFSGGIETARDRHGVGKVGDAMCVG